MPFLVYKLGEIGSEHCDINILGVYHKKTDAIKKLILALIGWEYCLHIDDDDKNDLEFNGERMGRKQFRESILDNKYDFDDKLLDKVVTYESVDDWNYKIQKVSILLDGKDNYQMLIDENKKLKEKLEESKYENEKLKLAPDGEEYEKLKKEFYD